jgi:ubiquinone/menaquinone biosynthesis C-methylase UbiE
MNLHEAKAMLIHPVFDDPDKKVWADLGCGSGTFTMALCSLLAPGSEVHAVDNNPDELKKIPVHLTPVTIHLHEHDFIRDDLALPRLDGMLMANSLHYVQHKDAFLKKIIPLLNPGGGILLVEYDTTEANPWIPFPIPYSQLASLFHAHGFSAIQKLNERPSVYNRAFMYSAILQP